MTKTTFTAIENIKRADNGTEKTLTEWETLCRKYGTTLATFRKYVKLTEVKKDFEWSVEKLVNTLNDCSGEDLYNVRYNLFVKNGKAYETKYFYKLER